MRASGESRDSKNLMSWVSGSSGADSSPDNWDALSARISSAVGVSLGSVGVLEVEVAGDVVVLERADVLGCVVGEEGADWFSDATGLEASAHPAKSRQTASTPKTERLSDGRVEGTNCQFSRSAPSLSGAIF